MPRVRGSENVIPDHPQGQTRKERAQTNYERLVSILTLGLIRYGGKTTGEDIPLTHDQKKRREKEREGLKKKYNL